MNILIVEDDVLARTATQRFLEYSGFDVSAAKSPVEAYRLACDREPDVLICDWDLSAAEDGVDVARRLQDETDTAVIFITGQSIADLHRACQGVEVAAIFHKPVLLTELKTMLDTLAKRH